MWEAHGYQSRGRSGYISTKKHRAASDAAHNVRPITYNFDYKYCIMGISRGINPIKHSYGTITYSYVTRGHHPATISGWGVIMMLSIAQIVVVPRCGMVMLDGFRA